MFGYINEHTIMGNVGAKPEQEITKTGKKVVKFSVATNRFWIDKNQEKQIHTEWHLINAYGHNAKIAATLKKGDKVLLKGRSQTYSYEDKEGITRKYTVIILDERSVSIDTFSKNKKEIKSDELSEDENEILTEEFSSDTNIKKSDSSNATNLES